VSQRARTLLRDTQASPTVRRVTLLVVLLVSALAVISLVLLSPLALAALNPNGSADWQRLADIAQTYAAAAASAVLALLALGGVALSLVFQAREMRAARLQALRMAHLDLMKLALDNPTYLAALGRNTYPDDEQRQQSLFVNLLISNWEMSYEMDEMSEIRLRDSARHLFGGEAGQRYWLTVRERRLRRSTQKRARRFHEILNEEFQKATTQPPPAPAPAEPEPEPETPESPAREESDQEPPEQSSRQDN
jgi:hypothetical protein